MNSAPLTQETIRIERAGREDLDALIALHVKCLPASEHFAVALGLGLLRAAYQWLLSSLGTFVLVAKSGDRIVGLTALVDRPYTIPMLRACKWDVLRAFACRPWLLFHSQVLSRLMGVVGMRTSNGDTATVGQIAWTAVHPDYRGRGAGRMLKNETVHLCRSVGMTAVVTFLKRGNLQSRKLNESAGFVVVPELCTEEFLCLRANLE